MRFKEFFKTTLTEGTKGNQADIPKFDAPGYFTVGDSHSNGIGNYGRGKTWKALGMDGSPASDPMHMAAIEKIPAGSVVAISLGANDFKAGKPISQIVSLVKRVVDAAKAKGLQVIYLLPTSTPKGKDAKQREELRSALSADIDADIVDLGEAGPDGLHLLMPQYAVIASKIAGEHTPKASGARISPDPKTNLGNPDQKPGAPTTQDRIKNSAGLEQGPPFPAEQIDEVKKMQQSLQELGYSVGRLGIDGKYGPATAAAVAAFKKDYNLKGPSSSFGDSEFKMLSQIQAGQVARVKEPTKTEFGGYSSNTPMADLKMDAVTKGKVGEVLNLVAGPESGGDYAKMFGGKSDPDILKMTMADLTQYQLRHAKKYGSSAAGRYQIMHFNTLNYARRAGLDPKTDVFSPENQDKMGIIFLRECGLEQWLNDKMTDEQFLEKLSRVWAGVPSPSKGGNSFYGGVGLNKDQTQLKMKTALNQLDKIGTATA
jgi:muramidase (phage lysozyme)